MKRAMSTVLVFISIIGSIPLLVDYLY